METYKDKKIGVIVKNDLRKADVFKKYQIDFCCGGGVSLESACDKHGLNLNEVEQELLKIDAREKLSNVNYDSWSIEKLTNHIITKHHAYVTEAIPLLFSYVQKVARVHGERHPELIEIHDNFYEICKELQQHMMKEENILFPYIIQLEKNESEGTSITQPGFGTVKNPIAMMTQEHESAGEIMAKIRELTNDYVPPKDACMTYKVSFNKLAEFEEDLHLHIHLENNILFPKAIALEEKLLEIK